MRMGFYFEFLFLQSPDLRNKTSEKLDGARSGTKAHPGAAINRLLVLDLRKN